MHSSTSVLLVDDDVSLAHSICDLLTILGYEVTWKADRHQAVAALCSPHRFDVVLLDLRLGIERGERVISEARSRGCLIPPIVILSAQPDVELIAAAQISQAASVLRKPCTAQGIKVAIENAVA